MKNKIIIGVTIVVLLILCVIGALFLFPKDDEVTLKDRLEGQNEIVLNDNNVPKYISGKFTDLKVLDKDTAIKALTEVKDLFKISNVSNEFMVEEIKTNEDVTYYEFQQKYNSIEVLGGELTMSVDKDGNVLAVNGNYVPNIKVSTYGLLNENEIKEKLKQIYGTETEYLEMKKYIYVDVSETSVVYDALLVSNKGAYEVVVNAKDGNVITADELGKSANYVYTGKGLNDVEHTINIREELSTSVDGGRNYYLYDIERKIQITDYNGVGFDVPGVLWSLLRSQVTASPIVAYMNDNGELYNQEPETLKDAVTAMKHLEDIYDYYKNVLGRDSYDNKGGTIVASLNVSKKTFSDKVFNNASWLPKADQMLIGYSKNDEDDENEIPKSLSLSKDVLAHEFTHGVVSYTADFKEPTEENRDKPNESGALDEAYADIIGSLIEGQNWIMGENNYTDGARSLITPEDKHNPSKVGGDFYYPNYYYRNTTLEEYLKSVDRETIYEYDLGGRHHNSTIVSHSAYLMYKNGAFSSKEQMAKVWYNSLFLLSSYSNFEDCAYAVIQSASNLGLEREKISIIKDAFVETRMLSQEYYKLSGKVTDEDDKELDNVLVTAINADNALVYFETYTNNKGEYEFTELPKAEYTISFEKAKYLGAEKDVTLDEDTTDINVSLEIIDEKKYKESEIVFVMDNSKSMDDSDPTDVRKQIIANVLGSLNNDAKVALVTFTADAKVINNGLKDKTVDKKIIITDIFNMSNDNGQNDDSGTNGAGGIQRALRLFSSNSKTRKYIVFLTDGDDNKQNAKSYDELIEKAKDDDIRILTIGLGNDVNSTNLIKIAKETNGKYYLANSSSKLYKFDKRIFDEIN